MEQQPTMQKKVPSCHGSQLNRFMSALYQLFLPRATVILALRMTMQATSH
jgi:hypothetical protein